MNTNFRIQGVNEFVRSLEKMDVETYTKLRMAFEKVASDIERDAKGNAPKKTGTLRRSIKSKVSGNPARIEAKIGTDVKYAPWQEEGTSGKRKAHSRAGHVRQTTHLTKAGNRRKDRYSTLVSGAEVKKSEGGSGGIPATHYLRDAYESNVPPFLMKLESIIHSLKL